MPKVTNQELIEIQDFLREQVDIYYDVDYDIMPSRITVIRNYMPDGPSWTGDLFFIVWGEADFITVVGKKPIAAPGGMIPYKYEVIYDIAEGELKDVGWV